MTMHIVGLGAYCENVDGELPALKQVVRDSVGKDVRRIGRFIQLALIGAGRACNDVPADTAVYLGSGRGDMGAMAEVMEAIFAEQRAPRPLSFINTVSNAACFYVAQSLGVEAASSFISSQYFSLESALQAVLVDAHSGRVDTALLGMVDAIVEPAEDHCLRLSLAPGTKMAEASHWLQLCKSPGNRPVLGEISGVSFFGCGEELGLWLDAQSPGGDTQLAFGRLAGEERATWMSRTGLALWQGSEMGYFDCLTAMTVSEFLARGQGRLLHVNRDPRGRYAVIDVHC